MGHDRSDASGRIHEQKQALRARMKAARAALAPDEHRSRSLAVCRRTVEELLMPLAPGGGGMAERPITVMGYMPFRTEVDVLPVIEWCWRQGHIVTLPRVERSRRRMTLHVIGGLSELVPSEWGIQEPAPHVPVWEDFSRIDVMLIPGLAFDERLGRLGYGGGYYDRWLAYLPGGGRFAALKIAPAFELQVVGAVPAEPHDLRVDALVTENRVVRFP